MGTSTADVLACGLSTLDVTYAAARPAAANEKIVARSYAIDAGGPALNAARTIRALGGSVALVTALGSGSVRELVTQFLAGIDVRDIAAPGYQLPISTVVVDDAGGRAVTSVNAGGAEVAAVPAFPADARALLVDGHLMDAAIPLAREAQARTRPVVLDGGSWKDGTQELMPHVTVAALSADFRVPGGEDPLRWCVDRGAGAAVRTRGGEAIDVLVDGEATAVEVPSVDVVDTLGAGDVFHGALSFALARGTTLLDAVRGAGVIASESVRHRGALGWAAS